nr:G protein-coupled receptor [Proales similis]
MKLNSSINNARLVMPQLFIERIADWATVYAGNALVFVGLVGNIISLLVFIRAGRKAPRIITRNLLILLSLSNIGYLLSFWYFLILNNWIRSLRDQADTHGLNWLLQILTSLHRVHSNNFVCKSIVYLIGLTICLNASITVLLSVERALAINFPLWTRAMRQEHEYTFHILVAFMLTLSTLFPVYNLLFAQLVEYPNQMVRCNIPRELSRPYFYLTLSFVAKTLALPFLIITFCNLSIIIKLYRNKNLLNEFNTSSLNQLVASGSRETPVHYSPVVRDYSHRPERSSHNANFYSKRLDKNWRVTKMLVAISASFVLFNLPYFIIWCVHADTRTRPGGLLTAELVHRLKVISAYLQLAEILNLVNYSMICFLYFATGKLYRKHLRALFKLK